MLIYSTKIILFIQELQTIVKNILLKEINVKVFHTRFYNKQQTSTYPINIVIYNDRSMLGYFDPMCYELGFHERLMSVNTEVLTNVIRHELAHYFVFINSSSSLLHPHGVAFQSFCREMGWGEDVSRATLCEETLLEDNLVVESDVLRKIQKLLALSTSNNKHEAEQAMIKSQQLLLKHNVETRCLGPEENRVCLQRIMSKKRRTAKMQAIARILSTFFVSVVFAGSSGSTYLEIVGTEINVQIAEYVAAVLEDKLEDLWIQVSEEHFLKGMTAKNSFFLGIAKGYCEKVNALKRSYQTEYLNALVILEQEIDRAKQMVYPKLSFVKSQRRDCAEASLLGREAGQNLQINPGISPSKNNTKVLLDYFT